MNIMVEIFEIESWQMISKCTQLISICSTDNK